MPSSRIELHEAAAAEYDAAFDWYLGRSAGVARRFSDEVDRALRQIIKSPQTWATAPFRTRRFLLSRFPFTLVYRELNSGDIQVVAVAHTSRRPGYWKQRL